MIFLNVTSQVLKRISESVVMFDSCSKNETSKMGRWTLVPIATMILTAGCASTPVSKMTLPSGATAELPAASVKGPVTLRLKAEPKTSETVDYFHVSLSRAFEGQELRHEKTETLKFTATAETTKTENIDSPLKEDSSAQQRFTQAITVTKKDGTVSLHDFAMPELGERLEVVTDSKGRILKAGDWPSNSIFYVSPISLPEGPVEVGDTWAMQSSWLSLQDMVPYELDMVSILKGFVKCGSDTCADIEVNGNVSMQGALQQALVFRSEWRGRLLFAMNAGTVAWSRVNSEEIFAYEKVYRSVGSCLESALREPGALSLLKPETAPSCAGFEPPVARAAPAP